MADKVKDSTERDKPDPTANVLLHVQAAVKRLDDLREAETRRVNEQMALRAKHYAELREAEAKRIDAIRSYDIGQGVAAATRGDTAALTLATQVANTAETLRALVATTASAHASALSQITVPIIERLALLEKAQYEGSGKQSVADPQIAQLALEVRTLRESGSQTSGMKVLIGWIVAAIFLALAIFAAFNK